ncbi:MAG: FAD-dependent oxidoreductase [Fimbriiglobus sp.]
MSQKRLAIIGNGLAAGRLVEELVRRNAQAQLAITVYGEENRPNYNRILLSRVLSGSEPEAITLKPNAWYAEKGITYKPGVRVVHVNPVTRELKTSDGSVEGYDSCVFATGSSAFVPPVQGLRAEDGTPREGVHVFRTIDDCIAIREQVRPGSSAIVVGGGLLGLEAAKGLDDLGVHVTILHRDSHLMNTQLDEPGGRILEKVMAKMGLYIRTKVNLEALLGNGHVTAVRLDTGEVIPTDLVVFACGISPRVDVAKASNIPVKRAIPVNDRMATSIAGLFAVGECAEHDGRVYGLVQPIWEQCAVLADVLAGTNPTSRYRGSKLYSRLKVAGVDVASFGVTDAEQPDDEVVQVREDRRGIYRKLIVRQGKLIGAVLVGCTEAAPNLVRCFDRDDKVPTNRIDLLATGFEVGEKVELELCNCNHVSEATVIAAIRNGCETQDAVCQTTRAGTGCGSCTNRISALLANYARTVSA